MSPVQCLLFFWMALWSGQLSSTLLYSIPPSVFWTSVRTWMEPHDVPSMLLKSVVFGLIIAVLALCVVGGIIQEVRIRCYLKKKYPK
jgi:phospholipid/cholesterol/gamma-HCH transport system permease protein